MTNKEIIARLKEAGHEVTGSPNRATLEALAAEKGVSLEEQSKAPDGDAPPPVPAYDPGRIITPTMAVVGMSGEGAAIDLPPGGEPAAEPSPDA